MSWLGLRVSTCKNQQVMVVHKALSWDMAMGVIHLVSSSWCCVFILERVSEWWWRCT